MVLAVFLVGRSAFGGAPVGPSTAVLHGTPFGLSVEYSQAEADLTFKTNGRLTEEFDLRTVFATLSAALTNQWEFFLRVGGSQAEAPGFDGDWNLAWGLGTSPPSENLLDGPGGGGMLWAVGVTGIHLKG